MSVIGLRAIPYYNQAKAALKIGSYLLAIGGGWVAHDKIVYERHLRKDAQQMAKSIDKARQVEGTQAGIATDVSHKREQAQGAARTVTQKQLKEVPYYVPSGQGRHLEGHPDSSSDGGDARLLTVGFGRLLDYAALGVNPPLPRPSEQSLSAPLPVGVPALATSVIGNYGVFHQCSAEVEAWKEWYRKEAAAWPVK